MIILCLIVKQGYVSNSCKTAMSKIHCAKLQRFIIIQYTIAENSNLTSVGSNNQMNLQRISKFQPATRVQKLYL